MGVWSNAEIAGENIFIQGKQLLEENPGPDDFESYQVRIKTRC